MGSWVAKEREGLMKVYHNELIGYVGYPAPEACTVKALHLSPIMVSSSVPMKVISVPISADADIEVDYHLCPQED